MGFEPRKAFPSIPCPGEIFQGKYRIERLVGEGGMGLVFSAHHELLDQRVALKLLSTDVAGDPENIARFVNEARLAARIKSEHVCGVMDVGTIEDGRPFIVMEFLEGQDLASLLRTRGPLPITEVVDFAMQALEGLAQAHARGIVHRDLKPSNLFLADLGEGATVLKLLDFGISKVEEGLSSPGKGGITSSRSIVGSPSYMSPEQIKSAKTVDARADIWALGVNLYELMTGALPFEADTPGAIFARILEDDPAPIGTLRVDAPPAVEAIVARCLRRKKEERFGSALELAEALATHGTAASMAMLERVRAAATKQYRSKRSVTGDWGVRHSDPGADSSQRLSAFNPVPEGPPAHPTHATWTGSGPAPRLRKPGLHTGVIVGLCAVLLIVAAGGSIAAYRVVFAKKAATASESPPVETIVIPSAAATTASLPVASASASTASDEPLATPDTPSPSATTVATPAPTTRTPSSHPRKKDLLKDRH